MPGYRVDGKIYDIPVMLQDAFEKDNPHAEIEVNGTDGIQYVPLKEYGIYNRKKSSPKPTTVAQATEKKTATEAQPIDDRGYVFSAEDIDKMADVGEPEKEKVTMYSPTAGVPFVMATGGQTYKQHESPAQWDVDTPLYKSLSQGVEERKQSAMAQANDAKRVQEAMGFTTDVQAPYKAEYKPMDWNKMGEAVQQTQPKMPSLMGEEQSEYAGLEKRRALDKEEDAKVDETYKAREIESAENVYANYRDRFALTEEGKKANKEINDVQSALVDKYSKEFATTPEYKAIMDTYDGTEASLANVNKAINDAFLEMYADMINEELAPYMEEYQNRINTRYADRIRKDMEEVARKENASTVNKLYQEVRDLQKEVGGHSYVSSPSTHAPIKVSGGSDAEALLQAEKLLQDSRNVIEEATKHKDSGFVSGVGRGVRDNLSPEDFTFGISDLADEKRLNNILGRYEKGEKVSDAEMKLLEASAANMVTHAYYDMMLSSGYKAGQVTAESLPFMLEFVANPIAGSGKALAKGLLKVALKKFGSKAINAGTKFGARLIGDALAAGGMTLTSGLAGVEAEATRRMNEGYDYGMRDGKLYVERKPDAISWGEARGKAFAQRAIENQSEMVFNAFSGVSKVLGGKGSILNKLAESKGGKFIKDAFNNKYIKEIAESTQFQGLPVEYMEEVYNNGANVLLGEMSVEDFADVDKNIETFLGLAPTSVVFGLLGLGGMAIDKVSNRRELNRIYNSLPDDLREQYNRVMQSKGYDAESTKEFVKSVITNPRVTEEEKAAAIRLGYCTVADMTYEDAEQAEQSGDVPVTPGNNNEDDVTEGAEQAESSSVDVMSPYEDARSIGVALYAEHDMGKMRQAYLRALYAMNRLRNVAGEDVVTMIDEARSEDDIERIIASLPEDQRRYASDYAVQSKTMDAIDEAIDTHYGDDEVLTNRVVDEVFMSGNKTSVPIVKLDDKTAIVVLNGMTADGALEDAGGRVMGVSVPLINGVPDWKSFDANGARAYQVKSEDVISMPTKKDVVSIMMGEKLAEESAIMHPAPISVGATFPVLLDGEVRDVSVVGQDRGNWLVEVIGEKGIEPVTNEELEQWMHDAELFPIVQEYAEIDNSINYGERIGEEVRPERNEAHDTVGISAGSQTAHEVGVHQGPTAGVDETTGGRRTGPENSGRESSVQGAVAEVPGDGIKQSALTRLAVYPEGHAKAGRPDYESSRVEDVRDYLLESLGEEKALKTVNSTIVGAESRLAEKADRARRLREEVENSSFEVEEMLRAQADVDAADAEVAALQKSVDYWKGVRTALGGEEVLMDKQGNPITAGGKLIVEEINSIDDISDDDFNAPTRTVALPQLPVNVSDAIGATGRRVVIKKSIFEKNKNTHPELSSSDSRSIISSALYNPNLIGNNQPIKRPDYKVAIRTGDKNAIVVLDVYQGKDNVEIVGWRKIGAKGLEKMKRQSEREGGQFLILSPNEGSAAALSALPSDVSSASKDNAGLSDVQEKGEELSDKIASAESDVDTSPTEAQKKAGNYKKGHVQIGSFNVTIEQPKGSVRSGVDKDGKKWSTTMQNTYGYIRGTEGVDGDHIDVFLSNDIDGWDGRKVFVVDQYNPDGSFDEHKVMLGFNDIDEADAAYLSNYGEGWNDSRKIVIRPSTLEDFEKWINSSHRKTKPFAEYKSVEENRRKPLRERVAEWANKLGIDMVVLENLDEVTNSQAREAIASGDGRYPGWYGEKSGKVYIYLPHVTDVKDIDETVIHEVVAHKGLRRLMGEKFDALCDMVWNSMSKENQDKFMSYPGVNGNHRAAADEYMAYIAEKTELTEEEQGIWDKIVQFVKDLITLNLGVKLSDAQIAGLIRASYAEMKREAGKQKEAETTDATTHDTKNTGRERHDELLMIATEARKAMGERQAAYSPQLPKPHDLVAAYEKNDSKEITTWKKQFEDVLSKMVPLDIPMVESTMDNILYVRDAQKHNKDSALYKAYNDIAKILRKQKSKLESQLTDSDRDVLNAIAYSRGERAMFRFAKSPQEFDATQKEAVEKRGIVMPGLRNVVVNVLNVPRHDFTGSLKEARTKAREWAIENYAGKEFDLPENAGKYVISKNAIGKYLDKSAFDKSDNAAVHLSALKVLPEIISNSIEAEIHADYGKGENGARSAENGISRNDLLVHRIYGAINIDGKTYRVKTTIHEFKDSNTANTPHSYEVTKIELIEDSTVTPNDGIDNPLNRSVNSISATKLLDGIEKSYDNGKKVLDESVDLTKDTVSDSKYGTIEHRVMFRSSPLMKGLRELEDGETCDVERIFTENKYFEFSGVNKIKSYSDVAYIFKQLEDESVENAFAVLVKRGKPTVIHLGMGHYTQSMVNKSVLNVAVTRMNPDKIYFVHNHPSGQLKASAQDVRMLQSLQEAYGSKMADGIIINTRSGQYGVFNEESYSTKVDAQTGLSDTSEAKPLKVYTFSKQVFSKDYQPGRSLLSSEDVARFVSSHRLGDRKKLGLIISNNNGITGNIFLPYTDINKDNARSIASDIIYYTSVMGGTHAVMFGNTPVRDMSHQGIGMLVEEFSGLRLLDYLKIDGGRYESASDEGLRFRRVKDSKNLVAVHNLSENNLRKVLEAGGLIMPSIAITDVNMGHSGYGEISLLFDKDTINPSDRRNKVYGGDAWTPRFPQMVPKLNGEVLKSIRNKIYNLLDEKLRSFYSLSAELHPTNMESPIADRGIDSFYGKEWMKIAYLLDNGKKFKVPMKMKDYGTMAEPIIKLAKERGLSLSDIRNEGYEFYKNNPDFVEAVQELKIEQRLSSVAEEEREKVRELLKQRPTGFNAFDTYISQALSMENDLNNGGLKQVIDSMALYDAINKKVKTDNADYNKWVDNLFDGVVEKYGIRNNRDWYTPSGNSRPWEQLYDPATPANILRHMLAENEQGGSGGLWNSNIMGASAETYESIDVIREKGKKRLHKVSADEYDAWTNSVSDRFAEICDEFMTDAQKNDFGGIIDAKIAITNAVAKDKTAKGIYKIMSKEYPKFTMEHAKRVEEIVKEIQDYATTYFEAKPQRIVELSEVRKAIVPSDVSSDILEGLEKNGIDVATYRKGNEQSRARLIKKESEGIRFRFIGEKGAANLDQAEEATTRLDNLAVAREMETEGKDALSIKMATGWERGADGKWRYEVMDEADALVLPNEYKERMRKEYEEAARVYDRLDRRLERFPNPRFLNDEQKEARKQLMKERGAALKDMQKKRFAFYDADKSWIKLSNLLSANHPLFAEYPELRDLDVSTMYDDSAISLGYKGYYREGLYSVGSVWISPLVDRESAKSIFIHEIQHAIQKIEGFAQGGNTDSSQPLIKEIVKLAGEGAETASLDTIAQAFEEGYVPKEKTDEAQKIAEKHGYSDLGKYIRSLQAYNYYRNIAGEVEARNASNRMGMSIEERSASLASETEDVAREDQIFIYDALESAMGSRVDDRMAEIANHFDGVNLSETQRTIVDVFGGIRNNLPISVNRANGETRRVVMRQGNELNAGTKHALYRHFNTGVGVITSDDIISIPDIVANGVRTEKRRGNTRLAEYKLSDVNGNEFTVLTEIKKGKEIFNDFYSNKKASLSGTFNTQSAHTANNNAFSADKDTDNISDVQEENETNLAEEGGVSFRRVEDKKLIEELEASPKRKGFRNVVLNEDGTFEPPMGNKLRGNGKTVKNSSFRLNEWEEAEEHPELVDENGKITLVKPNGKTVADVNYNPYIHNRLDKVNAQFKEAWSRPNLVYVETEVAETDLETGYRAEKSNLPVGVHSWSNGDLMLSRYDKPVRIVPWEEVADDWEARFKESGVHFDIVPPGLRDILVERGVEILPPHKGMGKKCKEAYKQWKEEKDDKVLFSAKEDVPELMPGEDISDYLERIKAWRKQKSREDFMLNEHPLRDLLLVVDEYEKRLKEQRSKISLLTKKIQDYTERLTKEERRNLELTEGDKSYDYKEIRSEIEKFIRQQISSDVVSFLNKTDLNGLLTQMRSTRRMDELENILLNVQIIATQAEIRKSSVVLNKLLSLKVQGRNGKNMSVARLVDDSTRKIFAYMRSTVLNMEVSGYEDDIKNLRAKAKENAENLAEKEKELLSSTGRKEQILGEISSLKEEAAKYEEEIMRLKSMVETVKTAKAEQTDTDIDEELAAMEERYHEKVASGTWTHDDELRLTALNLMQMIAVNKKENSAMKSLKASIDEEYNALNADVKAEEKYGYRGNRQDLHDRIDSRWARLKAMKMQQAVNLDTQLLSLRHTVDEMRRMIEGGKNTLAKRREAETERMKEILRNGVISIRGKHVNIMSDEMRGRKGLRGAWDKVEDAITLPLGSFEFMAKLVSKDGENGWLYKYFIQGENGVLAAYDTYINGMKAAKTRMNNAVERIFGKGKDIADVMVESDKVIESSGVYKRNNGEIGDIAVDAEIEIPLSRGQAMYIYMVWKMDDGRAKLIAQGFSENSITQIKAFIGKKYVAYADWIQDIFLPELREKYNDKYLSIYDTSLAEVEHYVPLRIRKESVYKESDLSADKQARKTLEQRAGSLINRVANINPVDINVNGFAVIADHVNQMEQWNAYARVRKDLDYLLSNNYFINQMNTNRPGSFERFYEAAAVATESFTADPAKYGDKLWKKLSKGVVSSNIAYRLNTALKQLMSLPAFLGFSQSPRFIAILGKRMGTIKDNIKWAMVNLPSFRERVEGGKLGDEKLDEKGFNKMIDKYTEIGMIPNKWVDAMACAIGARSIYEYRLKQMTDPLKKQSLDAEAYRKAVEEAHRLALRDADIYYNATQQSSHPAFLSPMQLSRTFVDCMLTTYQNSNIGYVRQTVMAFLDIKRRLNYDDFVKQRRQSYISDGMATEEALKQAKADWWSENGKSLSRFLLFGWGLNLFWNLGSQGLLGFMDGDDNDKSAFEIIGFICTSPLKGLPMGNMIEGWVSGYGYSPFLVFDEINEMVRDVKLAVERNGALDPVLYYEALGRVGKVAGVDLEVWSNIYMGVEDMIRQGKDLDAGRMTMDLMFVLNSPKKARSQVAKYLYRDKSSVEFAEALMRARKYVSEDNNWERWAPGVNPVNRQEIGRAMKEYDRLNGMVTEKTVVAEGTELTGTKLYNSKARLEDFTADHAVNNYYNRLKGVVDGLQEEFDVISATDADAVEAFRDNHQDVLKQYQMATELRSVMNKAKRLLGTPWDNGNVNDDELLRIIRNVRKELLDVLEDD